MFLLVLYASVAAAGGELRIRNVNEFLDFSNNVNRGTSYPGTTVFLDSDIDFYLNSIDGTPEPIGKSSSQYFLGTFDGQGYIIRNLVTNFSSTQYVGLFGYSKGATIKNIVVDNSCSFTSSYSYSAQYINNYVYAGGVIGSCVSVSATCTIENSVNMASVTFDGDISGKYSYIGGIVGHLNHNSNLRNCANYGDVTYSGFSNYLSIGGIVGYSSSSSSLNRVRIVNCFNYGGVTNDGASYFQLYIGGISGESKYTDFENCVDAGRMDVFSSALSTYEGGIAGYADSSSLSYCYWNDGCVHEACGFMHLSTVSESARFNSGFELLKNVSVFHYSGTSVIEALNAYSEYNRPRDLSNWILNMNENVVSFQVNNRSTSLAINSKLILLPSLANEGRLWFDGWYTDSECKAMLANFSVDAATKLYGIFGENLKYYTVSFDTRGGTFIWAITAQFGYSVKLPSNITKEDCEFAFWEDTYGERVEMDFTVPDHNVDLYAVWKCTRISTPEDFVDFSKAVNSGADYKGTTVFLDSDIELTGELLSPVGDEYHKYFVGSFDGQGHSISNLTMISSSQYVGLFGASFGSTIRNVVLDSSCSIVSSYKSDDTYSFVGGIMGSCEGYSGSCVIENSVNLANVVFGGNSSNKCLYLGGIVGELGSSYEYSSAVKNCANYGSITHSGESGYSYIGGVVGHSFSLLPTDRMCIQNCLNYGGIAHSGSTKSKLFVGGIVGSNYNNLIENCMSAGDITGTEKNPNRYIGCIVGETSSTSVANSFWTENIVSSASGSGDLIVDNETYQVKLSSVVMTKLNDYSEANSWNKWLLNTERASVVFKVNNWKPFATESQVMLLPSLAGNSERAFSGWYSDEYLTLPFTASEIASNTTLYGMFCGSKYTVTLDMNHGNGIKTKETFVECNGTYAKLPKPKWKGHAFVGWFTEREGGDKVESGDRVVNFNNHTLYAQWTAKTTIASVEVIVVVVVSVVVLFVAIIVFAIVMKKRHDNYHNHEDRKALDKPLISRNSNDTFADRYSRTVANSEDEIESSISAWDTKSVIPDLYPADYPKPTIQEALIAAELTDEQAYLVCSACENIAHVAADEDRLMENFTEEDAAAIAMYTYDFGPANFESNPHRIINRSLLSKNIAEMQKASGLLYLVMVALRKLPKVTNARLYRGINGKTNVVEEQYSKGSIIVWPGLTSVSTDMDEIKKFLAAGPGSKKLAGTLFIIEDGWGYDIQQYSLAPNDKEVILEPGRQFRVKTVIQSGEMTYINIQMLDTLPVFPQI